MDEDFFNNELIEGFEQMLDNREYKYYDSEDLVEIIEFYLEVNDSEYAKRALDFAEKMHPENIDIKIKRIEYLLVINELKKAAKLIQDLKDLAKLNGLGYQPLIKQILKRFVDAEKKMMVREYMKQKLDEKDAEVKSLGQSNSKKCG